MTTTWIWCTALAWVLRAQIPGFRHRTCQELTAGWPPRRSPNASCQRRQRWQSRWLLCKCLQYSKMHKDQPHWCIFFIIVTHGFIRRGTLQRWHCLCFSVWHESLLYPGSFCWRQIPGLLHCRVPASNSWMWGRHRPQSEHSLLGRTRLYRSKKRLGFRLLAGSLKKTRRRRFEEIASGCKICKQVGRVEFFRIFRTGIFPNRENRTFFFDSGLSYIWI